MPSLSTSLPKLRPYLGTSFLMFLLFNLCFLGLQIVFVYTTASSFVSSIALPWQIYKELIATLFVHVGLYVIVSYGEAQLLFGILQSNSVSVIPTSTNKLVAGVPHPPRGQLLPMPGEKGNRRGLFRNLKVRSIERWQFIVWSLGSLAILSLNAYYFPLSMFSKLIIPPLSPTYILFVLILSLLGLGLLLINRMLYLKKVSLLLLGTSFLVLFLIHRPSASTKSLSSANPNIIILGIDSLSLENVDKQKTPFLYQRLKNSVQFTQAVSPLARTFPAWCSILTGLYAKHHHADENLISKNGVNKEASIVWTLNQLGYDSLFASDDRRFNSLDVDFGFKHIIGPKLGVNDVILGSFNDFPLSNLLINFSFCAFAFPYNYMNRASFFSYYPSSFNEALQKELLSMKQGKQALFLSVHFTLPHWPYALADSLPELAGDEFSHQNRSSLYEDALKKVDRQFAILFHFLKEQGFLNNSLVIVLSDHGEALYTPNSRLTNYKNYQGKLPSPLDDYFKSKTATLLDKSAGHGSDILSPLQYHSMLGFSLYKNGKALTHPAAIKTRVSLIDITPTIRDFIHANMNDKMDGISLLPSILNPRYELKERSFFIESGMFPNQDVSKQKALQIGQALYKINENNGELELKQSSLKKINQEKLYGVIKGDWILALYPDGTRYIPVIQNLKTGLWTDDLDSKFAKLSPSEKLNQELRQFYGRKLAF